MPTAFSLSLTARTSALRYLKTSVISSKLAVSSSTTRSFSGVMHLTFLLSCVTITRVRAQHFPQHTSMTGTRRDEKALLSILTHTLNQAAYGAVPIFRQFADI